MYTINCDYYERIIFSFRYFEFVAVYAIAELAMYVCLRVINKYKNKKSFFLLSKT